MLIFNNTIKSPLTNIEIKGNNIPCGLDNGDGTFKIKIIVTNGLDKTDSKYKETIKEIKIPCKLGMVNNKQDIIKFDKISNQLILEQNTDNGKVLENPKIHKLHYLLNVIGFDGKTTLMVSDGTVEAIVKATVSKTLFSSQHSIIDTLSDTIDEININNNEIEDIKIKLDSHKHINASNTEDGFMSKEDKIKLDSVEYNANNYTHPNTHPASMIVTDINNRFVSDTEKNKWNEISNLSTEVNQIKDKMNLERNQFDEKLKTIDIITSADKITIQDKDDYFKGSNVEDALKELAIELNGQRVKGIQIANNLLSKIQGGE